MEDLAATTREHFAFKHSGIFGRTQTGKSFLLKIFCDTFTKAGRKTLVYDITLSDEAVEACNAGNGEWNAMYVTNSLDVFLAVFWGETDLIVFVDEGNEAAGRGSEAMRFATTRGSHQRGELGAGNSIFYGAHSYTGLDKALRGQLSDYYVFACAADTAKDLSNEFDEPRIRDATHLPIGGFYHVGTGFEMEEYRIDFKNKRIIKIENQSHE